MILSLITKRQILIVSLIDFSFSLHFFFDAEANGEGERGDGDAAPKPAKGGLKAFVEQFKDRHYYVIEMRIVLICCIAVFFKLFFSEVIGKPDSSLTYCALALITREFKSNIEGSSFCLFFKISVYSSDCFQHVDGLFPLKAG